MVYFYLRHVFHNDNNAEKTAYVEQGIVIFIAVSSACISFITNRITSYNNDVDKYEQIEREKQSINAKMKSVKSKRISKANGIKQK